MIQADGTLRPRLVWDWPLRLFHWLLVLAIAILFVTGKLGGNWMEWHKRTGYVVLGLVFFRLIWGVAGGYYARFANFVRGPRAVLAFVRGRHGESQMRRGHAGHNPLGALSVLAMLLAIALQAGTGLFANDDILLEGPYASLVSKELSDWLTGVHKINSNVILGLIALHLIAIAFYFFRRKTNLVMPMLTGRKLMAIDAPQASRPAWLAALAILVSAASVYLMVGR